MIVLQPFFTMKFLYHESSSVSSVSKEGWFFSPWNHPALWRGHPSLVINGMDLLKLEPLGMLEMGFTTYRLILRKKQAVKFVGKSVEYMSWRGRMLSSVFSIMFLSLKSRCQWWTGTLENRSIPCCIKSTEHQQLHKAEPSNGLQMA